MGIFVGIIIVVIAIACGIWAFASFENNSNAMGAIATMLCIIGIIAFILVPFSFHTVNTGEVAVVKTFGEAKEVKGPGLNWDFWAINKYEYINTKTQELPIQTMAYSSDAQPMTIEMTVQYQILADEALSVVKTYGTAEALTSRITAIVTEAPKTVLSSRAAMDIIANRAEVTPEVEQAIIAAVGDQYFITVNKVTIANIDFSDAFEQAVEDKMIAEQAKLKAEYENEKKVAQAKAEADAKVAAAEAEIAIAQAKADAELKKAQAQKAIAEAEAEALRVKAQAEADANKLIAESITDDILAKLHYDKWDGKLPTVVGNDSQYILPSDIVK